MGSNISISATRGYTFYLGEGTQGLAALDNSDLPRICVEKYQGGAAMNYKIMGIVIVLFLSFMIPYAIFDNDRKILLDHIGQSIIKQASNQGFSATEEKSDFRVQSKKIVVNGEIYFGESIKISGIQFFKNKDHMSNGKRSLVYGSLGKIVFYQDLEILEQISDNKSEIYISISMSKLEELAIVFSWTGYGALVIYWYGRRREGSSV